MPKLSKFQPLSPSLCGHHALLLSILLFTGDHLSTSIIWPNSLPLVSLTNFFSTLPWHTSRHKCSHHSLLRKLWQSPSQLLPPQEVQCPSIPGPTSTPVPILTPLTTPDSLPSYKVQLPPPDICFFSPTAACFRFSFEADCKCLFCNHNSLLPPKPRANHFHYCLHILLYSASIALFVLELLPTELLIWLVCCCF